MISLTQARKRELLDIVYFVILNKKNGVVECMNRNLREKVRCMLSNA